MPRARKRTLAMEKASAAQSEYLPSSSIRAPYWPVWAAGDAEPLYLLGHLVWSWSALITPPLDAYLPTTTTSTPLLNVLGIWPLYVTLTVSGLPVRSWMVKCTPLASRLIVPSITLLPTLTFLPSYWPVVRSAT